MAVVTTSPTSLMAVSTALAKACCCRSSPPATMARGRYGNSIPAVNRANHWHDQGRALQEANKLDQARAAYQEALSSSDQPALNTLANLIVLEINADRLDHANAWYEEGIGRLASLHPITEKHLQSACLLMNSGLQLQLQLQRFQIARHLGQQLMQLQSSSSACTNLAVSSRWNSRLQAAVRAQRMALNLPQGSCPRALLWQPASNRSASQLRHIQLMNLATYQLTCNPLDPESWQLLEARLGCRAETWGEERPPWESLWNGTPCHELLVWDEQGYGDCIQSLRWIPEAAQRCEVLRLMLRPELKRLVQKRMNVPTNCHIEALNHGQLPWDTASSTRPGDGTTETTGSSIRNCKKGEPYLTRHEHKSDKSKLKIGVVWAAGCKDNPEARRAARLRDCPPEELHRWVKKTRVEAQVDFINLQRPDHPQNVGALGTSALSPTGDWFETAELLESLDGLITVDTAMAHLGGAMGLPTLILLNQPCDWRWGQTGKETSWYKSCEIARCGRLNQWKDA